MSFVGDPWIERRQGQRIQRFRAIVDVDYVLVVSEPVAPLHAGEALSPLGGGTGREVAGVDHDAIAGEYVTSLRRQIPHDRAYIRLHDRSLLGNHVSSALDFSLDVFDSRRSR